MSAAPTTVYALAWSPDSSCLAAAHDDATVQIYEATTGRILQVYRGHTSGVFVVTWSPDGRFLASGGDDATVQIWEPDWCIRIGVIRMASAL